MGSRVGTWRRAKPTHKHSWETASPTNAMTSSYPLPALLWTTHPERWCSGDPNYKEITPNSYCGIPITLLMGEFYFLKTKMGAKQLSPVSRLGLTWPVLWVNGLYLSKPSHTLGSSRANQAQDICILKIEETRTAVLITIYTPSRSFTTHADNLRLWFSISLGLHSTQMGIPMSY